jgi:hypothetical protein
LSSTFHGDANGLLTCFIWARLKNLCMFKPWQYREPLPGHCCPGRHCLRIAPHSNCHISKFTLMTKVFLSILQSSCHKQHIANGLTLMTPSLRGWEVLPTLGALTHTRIAWALSPMAPQVPGVTPGSPCAHGVSGTPHGEVRKNFAFICMYLNLLMCVTMTIQELIHG